MADPSLAQALLADLNPPQRQAVTSLQGAVMILAGAGSGKTRALTRRLAYLLATDTSRPEEVLAVTFTNKAAREMRERIAQLLQLDERSLRRLWIGTFHGLGARILRHHASLLGYEEGFTILDASDQERLVKRLVEEMGITDPYWTPARLAASMARWKDDGIGPGQLGEEHVRYRRDLVLVADFYQRYQDSLKKANCMDFGDLLWQCLQLWQAHPLVLDQYRQRFRYVLVDEYQDTNHVQYQWLRHLASGHGNLCVVGDDDQSIYSWRGARMGNILDFKSDYPDFSLIRLEQNYRSTGNILKAASGLIGYNAGRMGKTLWTEGADGPLVELYPAEDGEDEARFVANEISRQCVVDGDYRRAAILVRASRQTRSLEEALMRANIPYQVVGGLRFLDRAEVKDAIAYLRLVYSWRDDLAFDRVINVPRRGVGPVVLQAIQETARREQLSLMEAAERLSVAKELRTAARNSLAGFIALIRQGQALLQEQVSLAQLLEHLLQSSGYLESLKEDDRFTEKQENLQELHSQLVRYEDLALFLEDAALVTDMGKEGLENANRVVLSTLHAAKGLEFSLVFLVGLEEGLLPHQRALEEGKESLEEERRLLYVGMTRARERLFITHAKRRWMYKQVVLSTPSRFLKELPAEALQERRPKLAAAFGVHAAARRTPWEDHYRKRW